MTSSTQIYVFIVFAVRRRPRLARLHHSDKLQDLWKPTGFRSYGAAGNFLRCIYKDFAPTKHTSSP
jgi:hypothetical protein